LLGDLNAKVGREDIFKRIIGNDSLHEISNNNGMTALKFDMPMSSTKVSCEEI